ncbi:guanylate cyclase [Spirochaetia bacterium]|nr:guanylate cyclase [Spirochaetia bacterium]
MSHWRSALIGFSSALLFSILGVSGLFVSLENRIYDFFLRSRPKRERLEHIVFLDVDNEAIASNGVFPWPRSVMADGLLRLKEYGARAVIFDIEYVDKGPQGVDDLYLERLPSDFNRTFSEINNNVADLVNSLLTGRLARAEAGSYARDLYGYINDEGTNLLQKTEAVARNNDEYLTMASALYGNSWVTLNLRTHPLEGEQASRRPMAEELFSYPVKVSANVPAGTFADILPPIPSFARSARGAGFTRAYVDSDGVRRRIDLVQEFNGFRYLQLAFAPLVDYLGNPGLELEQKRLTLRNAQLPSGETKDITIPLDSQGRMLLDWPLTSFEESFTHFSFAALSRLEQDQAEIERSVFLLSSSENLYSFSAYDNSLAEAPSLLYRINELLSASSRERSRALTECSYETFAVSLAQRDEAWELLYHFRDLALPEKLGALENVLVERFPDNEEVIREESGYLRTVAENLSSALENYGVIQETLKTALKGKFCIVGQTDAGTTDIGVNPFHNEYVNVGTQGVVLDTVLAESFITWLSPWWSVLFCIITPILIFLFAEMPPGLRPVLGVIAAVVIFFIAFFLFRFTGIFLSPAAPAFSLVLAAIFREIAAYIVSDQEKQFIRKAFSTYVSTDVVEELIADPSLLQLGGAKRHMSAIFTDIRNFSTIAEQLDAEHLVSLLNRYLTAMSDVILKEKGTIDKYEGDAIIAFFGAPLDLSDHARRACLSAVTMKRTEQELNRIILEHKLSPGPLQTRIGINTGTMVAGNMGTGNKMNYTIMGNTVNLASRLEGVNKQYETWILATSATIAETGDEFLTRRLDRVRVVGITEPVQLYELIEIQEAAMDWQKETAARFEKALEFFEDRDWKTAAEGFQELLAMNPADGPGRIYLERCTNYLVKPPAENWDGVFVMGTK